MEYRRSKVREAKISGAQSFARMTVEYALIALLLYLSGNIFFMSVHYAVAVPTVAIVVVLTAFAHQLSKGFKLAVRSGLQLCLYAILMGMTVLLSGESALSAYLAIFTQMGIAALVAEIISVEEFAFKSSQIMAVLAVISLVFFAVGWLYPEVVRAFPRTAAIASVDYYNAGIYVYQAPIGYGELLISARNSGIFWEPGAYQAFLNLGLFFLLEERMYNRLRSRRTWQTVATVLAVLTTVSAMGYILLAFVLWHGRKSVGRLGRSFVSVLTLLLGAGAAGILYSGRFGIAFTKYLIDPSLVLPRLGMDKLGSLGGDWISFLFGSSFSLVADAQGPVWNSIIQTALVFGVLFTGILLFNYWRGAVVVSASPVTLFFILVMSFSTESLIWRPYYLYFVFAHLAVAANTPFFVATRGIDAREPKRDGVTGGTEWLSRLDSELRGA